MKKIALLGTVLVAGVVLVGCGQTKTSRQAPSTNSVVKQEAPKNIVASTNYVPYSSSAVAKANAEGKDVAVFFHSKTCGSCKKLDENLVANDKNVPNDMVILKADWDENQELAKELKVEKYHTVAFLNEDGTSNNVKGVFTLDELVDAGTEIVEVEVANNYVGYSPTAVKLAQAEGKDVAVFFHSKTCGSCKKLDENLVANAGDLSENMVILKADWDENQELARELKVEKYHTVAFLNEDGTSTNVKGLFTVGDVNDASSLPATAPTTEKTISNNYIAYAQEVADVAMLDGKDVAVFFHSKTCGSCKKLDENLVANTGDLSENMVILKADWDENQELARELKVEKYHTVAFLNEDGTSNNVKGLFTLEELLAAK